MIKPTRRLSSGFTFYLKRVHPVILFGFLILFVAIPIVRGAMHGVFPPLPFSFLAPFLIGPAIFAVIFYLFMKKFVFDLVDEVLDDGSALIVRCGDRSERIALSEITNVNYSASSGVSRVTLSLRKPTAFGDKIAFCTSAFSVPLWTPPVVDELIRRIDAAREARRASR